MTDERLDQNLTVFVGDIKICVISEHCPEQSLIGMQFNDFVMVAADQTNAR